MIKILESFTSLKKGTKLANALFGQKKQHFAQFLKLIKEMLIF